jgi:glycolate oxidase FAD binding subunit
MPGDRGRSRCRRPLSGALAPADEAAIAAIVAEAAGAGEPLAIVGNATKAGMLRPVQAARSLSTRNLTGITLYSPNELVI